MVIDEVDRVKAHRANGREVDFPAYVEAAQPRLLRAAFLMTGSWPLAEDLVQTTLMKLWPRWSRVTQQDHVDAYVRKVLVNAYLSHARRRAYREVVLADLPEPRPMSLATPEDCRADLLRAIAKLPPRQKAVVALRYYEDLSETQTAHALDCAPGTVKSLSARAFATLRQDPSVRGLLEGEAHD